MSIIKKFGGHRSSGRRVTPNISGCIAFMMSIAAAAAADPAGIYNDSGVGARDGSKYFGTVAVEKTGDAYKVTWDIAGKRYDGTGIMLKDVLAVLYRFGDATGVALYEQQGDGWNGVYTYAGGTKLGSEMWTRQGPPLSSSVKDIFEKYNLIGVFARDCTQPPKREENWYFVNRLLDADHVQRDLMEGPTTRTWVTIIDRATELRPNEIAVSGIREGKRGDAIWHFESNRMLQWEVTHGDEKLVSEGKWVKTGKDMPWLNRCS